MSLAARLWRANADLAAACTAHPFVRGIAAGTLARDTFAGYVAQDAFFLDSFARAYAFAAAHAPDRASRTELAALLAGVTDELALHDSYAARWGVDLGALTPTEATLAYTDFLLARAGSGDVGLTCTAMTPCLRLYADLGRRLLPTASGPYLEWVQTYAAPEFDALAARLEALLDRLAADDAETARTYRRAMTLELAFFDAALG